METVYFNKLHYFFHETTSIFYPLELFHVFCFPRSQDSVEELAVSLNVCCGARKTDERTNVIYVLCFMNCWLSS